ncbi:hypothetical protein EOS_32955 [Caballeronia mineralivorans PML1(12)]|uniref:Uncharacterized protein n=1 Tax=Caballeronia mineralivorans PML1(12) TaxID=908627 RepID=A0A0J1CME3_9BURK|nr:hypothetical protein [Caballeronia mineralivorans]KLU21955.1 hypothetical protein EOS_32955 [Caballeronia mineralivorans PML1(12)]
MRPSLFVKLVDVTNEVVHCTRNPIERRASTSLLFDVLMALLADTGLTLGDVRAMALREAPGVRAVQIHASAAAYEAVRRLSTRLLLEDAA